MKIVGIVHRDVGDCFGIYFPEIPGCFSAGDSIEELAENAQDALQVFKEEDMLPSGAGADWKDLVPLLNEEDLEEMVSVLVFEI